MCLAARYHDVHAMKYKTPKSQKLTTKIHFLLILHIRTMSSLSLCSTCLLILGPRFKEQLYTSHAFLMVEAQSRGRLFHAITINASVCQIAWLLISFGQIKSHGKFGKKKWNEELCFSNGRGKERKGGGVNICDQ